MLVSVCVCLCVAASVANCLTPLAKNAGKSAYEKRERERETLRSNESNCNRSQRAEQESSQDKTTRPLSTL